MPPRQTPLIAGYTYHIFNKTIEGKKVFENDVHAQLMLSLLSYYRSSQVRLSYSRFRKLQAVYQLQMMKMLLKKRFFKVDILSYCLMPTHFHLLLKQNADGGISKFISDVLNALTRHLNLQNERKGPLFLPRFQAILIRSREQLIHVSRYIHLNPYSAGLVTAADRLGEYPWSSYATFISEVQDVLCDTRVILAEFDRNKKSYEDFVLSNAEYQKARELIKHTENWQNKFNMMI